MGEAVVESSRKSHTKEKLCSSEKRGPGVRGGLAGDVVLPAWPHLLRHVGETSSQALLCASS